MLNGKRLKFKKHEPKGCCHSCGFKCLIGHSSKTFKNPKDGNQKEATRQDTKNISSKHKNWNCSYYEEYGFWAPDENK